MNLGQLWQGPQNGNGTQEQYLYCDSSHPHQLSNLSEVSSSPTCSSKGTIDYTGSYDAWGNTTSQQRGSTTKSTAYDAQDHLLHWSSTTNNQQEWYLYDASGERVLRRSFDGTNTTLTVYAFGLEEHQYAYSGSGSTATNTGNTYYYTLAGRLLGTWDGTSPTTTFLLTDSLGSVVSSFNNLSSGAVMQGNQLYGPYGNQRLKQGSLSTNKGFTGQYNDGLTGLDYYGARYYDPTIGLFLSADDVEGNIMGMDPYSYVEGNPETETDPTGNLAYSPETGQVAIPQPDGRYVITGYNAGLNGTFNPKVYYTPVAFQPSSFWPRPAAPAPLAQPTTRHTLRDNPAPTTRHTRTDNSAPVAAAAALTPGLLNLAQYLIQNNESLRQNFGSDQWTVLRVKRGTDIVEDDSGGIYTDRWYFTMKDQDGSKVVLSLNLNPNAGPNDDPWDMRHIHFSSNEFQPDKGKWGTQGYMRNGWGIDKGASDNPGDIGNLSDFEKDMLASEQLAEEAVIVEDVE